MGASSNNDKNLLILEINIIYNIDKEKKINIFGKNFVNNNNNNCKMIINDIECNIEEEYKVDNSENNELKIKLNGIHKITDMSQMFYGCSTLLSVPDIYKWNTIKVTNMKGIFDGCSLLKSLPDISRWNTSNVTDISDMFNRCSSLSSLPDISKWNTDNVINMSYLFYNCGKLSLSEQIILKFR